MTRRTRARPTALDNFAFQALKFEILSDAEFDNRAEVWLFKHEWDLMWRMCGKQPVETTPEGDEYFLYEGRQFVKKAHEKPPSGVLDRTKHDDDEE